jgi:hypothetical protein
MGTKADEQIEEEIASNAPDAPDAPDADDDEQLVELDLETGEVTPIVERPPSFPYRIIGWLGRVLLSFADNQGGPAKSFDAAVTKYEQRRRGLYVLFGFAALAVLGVGELVAPFFGVLLIALYLFYFVLINISGATSTIAQLKQAVAYYSGEAAGVDGAKGKIPESSDGHVPGGGNYL